MSYSIDQFSKITGINKLLLRTWENRYNFLKPARTDSKIRFYSDELLIKALNAKLLIDNGHKISLVSKKTDIEIEDLLNQLIKQENEDSFCDFCVNNFVKAALKFDTKIFNETYFSASKKFKAIEFYKKIMLPTFKKIGLFWLTNKMNPAQEHFLSEMFKQKIYSQINVESEKNGNNKKNWVLFLPPNEHHEMGLLFTRYLLLSRGYNVIYLGANVPLLALSEIVKYKEIDFTLFFVVSNFAKLNFKKTIQSVNKYFNKSKNYIVTNQMLNEDFIKENNVSLLQSVDDFLDLL